MAKPTSTPAPIAKSTAGPSQGDAAAAAALAASAPIAAQPAAAKTAAVPAPKPGAAKPAPSGKDAGRTDGREKEGRDVDARDGADVAMADANAPAYAELAEAQAAAVAQTPAETQTSEDDGDEGGMSTALIIGGVLLGGAGIALAAGGGGDSAAPPPAPPPTPPANAAPTVAAATQAVTTNEDTARTVTVVATDSNGDTLTYAAGAATNGTVTGGTGGAFTYTPRANFAGTDSFVVTVSDGRGGTVTQTVNVTVTAVNDAPTIAATQTVATNEDTPVTVTAVATDIDSTALTYATSAVTGGTVAAGATPGSFVFTPNANFNGAGSFVVTASDGSGGTASQNVTVNVAAVNDAPTIDATATRTLTTPEDAQVAFVIDASDVDTPDAQLTARIATAPANGTIVTDAQGNSFYRPNANFSGNDSFVVAIGDGQATTSYTVSVTVTPVNDAPVFAAPTRAVTTDEDAAVTFAPGATDIDGDALTYTVGQVANGTAAVGADGRVTFTPAANFSGQTSFVVSANDGRGGTASQTVTVTVGAVNDAPVFAAATLAVAATEDQPVSFTTAATDADGDTLTYTAAAAANGVVTSATNGTFTYTPNANFAGTDTVTITATDGRGGTATQTVTITVANVNDAPAFAAATRALSTGEDQAVTFVPVATDVDGDALTYSVGQFVNGTAAVGADGQVTFTPAQDFSGNASFVLTANDGRGGAASQIVTVAVASGNDAPRFADATRTVTTAEDTAITFLPVATDADGDPLTFTVGPVSNGTASVAADGRVTFTPAANFNGQTSFTITASDGRGGTATQAVTASVTPVNDAPAFAAATQAVTTDEDTAVTVTAMATDIDGDALSYSAGGATNGTVTAGATPGSFVFTPAQDFAGAASFVITARDAAGEIATQTVNISVTNRPNIVDLDTLDQVGNGGDGDPTTVRIFDAGTTDFRFDDSSGQPSNTRLDRFGTDDVLQVDDAAENYNFSSNGTDIFISYQTPTGVVNLFTLGSVVADPGVLVFDEASAERAAGFDFFRSTAAQQGAVTVSLDADTDNNLNTIQNFSGAGAATTFTQNANTPDFVRVSNFGADDRILVSNAATSDFNFSSNGTDIFISYQTPGGASNDITLAGAVRDGSVLVSDEASAERAVGFNFFQAAGTTPTPPPVAQTTSLDADTDNNSNTQATFDASTIAATFTENANLPNFARVTGMSSDDRILVSNAAAGDFNFSSNGRDIFITYQTPGGTVNDITLVDAVRDGTVLVFDEATAERAAGFDFFQFG